MQKIFSKITILSLIFALFFGAVAPTFVSAEDINNSLCTGSGLQVTTNPGSQACSGDKLGNPDNTANGLVKTIIDIFSAVVGILAVIMIIVAGFRYVTSGGSDEAVKGAKNTIIYAIIGLVVVALAQLIVHFVLAKTTQASFPCVSGHVQGGPNDGKACK